MKDIFLITICNVIQGFYGVYDEVFKTLAEEDKQFLEDDEIDDYHVLDFGNSQSIYEEVKHASLNIWYKNVKCLRKINIKTYEML